MTAWQGYTTAVLSHVHRAYSTKTGGTQLQNCPTAQPQCFPSPGFSKARLDGM